MFSRLFRRRTLPNSTRAGRKLLQEEHFAEAIQQLTEAVRLDPALALAYNARGYAYYRLKQYPQAIADFDRAISLNPGYGNAYQNRGAARGSRRR